MLLQLLRDRGTAVVPGYQERAIAAIIPLDDHGRYLGAFIDNIDTTTRRAKRLPTPFRKRTVAPKPLLFADGADYLFGIPEARTPGETEKHAKDKATTRQALHHALAEQCVSVTANAKAAAALKFLVDVQNDPALRSKIVEEVASHPGDLAIRVGSTLVTKESEVERFWAAELGLLSSADEAGTGVCATCGQKASIPERWPTPIKGIPGGQTSGTQLVSMNSDVFESYGQPKARGAGVCAPCAERIANALNELLADPHRRVFIGKAVYVAWHDGDGSCDIFDYIDHPQPEAVRALLRAPLTARSEALNALGGELHTLALTGNGGRAAIRAWIETTIPTARRSLERYFNAQMVIGPWGEEPVPLRLASLAGATVREFSDLPPGVVPHLPPGVVPQLLAGILAETPLPPSLLANVVRRVIVEKPKVTHPQAALMTWYLTQISKETAVPHQLDIQSTNPAYLCGRALAEIDAIQRRALPNINSGVVDRYFAAAASRPATVLGMLLRGAQDHLKKIQRESRGAADFHQRQLEEILTPLQPAGFPATLPLIDQTWFCLGFYHQRAAARAARNNSHATSTPIAPQEATS